MSLKFENFNLLQDYTNKLKNRINDNETAYCEQEDKWYCYTNDNWIEKQSSELNISLFDINAQLINQLPDFNEKQIKEAIDNLNNYYTSTYKNYYLLLCKEISYYTLFTTYQSNYKYTSFGEAVIDCLSVLGSIKSIQFNESDCEIWMNNNNKIICLHLFDYTDGVVSF